MAEVSLFIVRVWQQATGFRAALRRVDDEAAPRCFDSPEQVTEFLVRASAPASKPAGGDGDASDPTQA